MEKQIINPPGLYKHPGFNRVITVKGPCKFIFIAGQTPSDENYEPVCPGDLLGQYNRVMEVLSQELAAAGATWNDVIYRRVYVLDMLEMKRLISGPSIKRPWDPENAPASTMIGVTALSSPGFMIEMDLMAVTES
jgi:enamine deaminase RidA (YjgF/YER057c/UK114 family)